MLTWLLKDSLGGNSKTIMIASNGIYTRTHTACTLVASIGLLVCFEHLIFNEADRVGAHRPHFKFSGLYKHLFKISTNYLSFSSSLSSFSFCQQQHSKCHCNYIWHVVSNNHMSITFCIARIIIVYSTHTHISVAYTCNTVQAHMAYINTNNLLSL